MLRKADILRFSYQVVDRSRFRTIMIFIAMGLGVAAVVILTALGEGARGYVMGEFSFLGKNVLIVLPGKNETTGGRPPVTGTTARDITIDDVRVLQRRVAAITEIAPIVVGSAEVSFAERTRQSAVIGASTDFAIVRQLAIGRGSNLPRMDLDLGSSVCVLGGNLKAELFDQKNAIGEWVSIGGSRFRVIGILEGRGDAMGMDLSDAVLIPVASAQRLFNVPGLFRVLVRIDDASNMDKVKQRISAVMTDLHQGIDDVTVVSPDAMLSTFNKVFTVLTLGVGAIGGLSLLVAGVLIMNVMLISVTQRTAEIGILKALGASARDVLTLFLVEALLMVTFGTFFGLLLGQGVVWLASWLLPTIPFATPIWAYFTALLVAIATGLGFSFLPARRASQLLPVTAMQKNA